MRRLNCDFLPVLSWGDLQLDPCSCQVSYREDILSLSAKEYRLLELFLRHDREVLSIADIIESLWSSMEYPAEATVRSHIRRLREKLKLAGLPEDIITTVRGQGYCLKSLPQSNYCEQNSPINPVTKSIPTKPELLKPESLKREQHVAALTSIWQKHQPKRQQQLATLEQAISFLQAGNLEISIRLSAIVAAHSLAGNLGQFGLDRASQIAKELEQLLQNNPTQEQWLELSIKLNVLSEEIASDRNISVSINRKISENSPLLLIVGNDTNLNSQLAETAVTKGIRTKILSTPELVTIWLAQQQNQNKQLPQAVLLNISFADAEVFSRQEYLALIAEFKLLVPSIPVIVIADRDRFQERLQVARHGGSFYFTQPINPSQTITFCQRIIQRSSLGKKIMIVDDDIELLQVLPSLLQPWEFNLTTLDDPRQFWDVLQTVAPDLLVLDIEMPHLSGIELCKVLRTHPYWCKLPVLFLSVHTDKAIFTQALASGANGFVNKPLVAQQLVSHILNLLVIHD